MGLRSSGEAARRRRRGAAQKASGSFCAGRAGSVTYLESCAPQWSVDRRTLRGCRTVRVSVFDWSAGITRVPNQSGRLSTAP